MVMHGNNAKEVKGLRLGLVIAVAFHPREVEEAV
jgi:hypothetical protein